MSTAWAYPGLGDSHDMMTAGRYVGAAKVEANWEPFAAKMERLTSKLSMRTDQESGLASFIRTNLRRLHYEI